MMTKERWNLLTRIEKHEFLYEKAQELYGLYSKKNNGASSILINSAELADIGIDSDEQRIECNVEDLSNDTCEGYAYPALGSGIIKIGLSNWDDEFVTCHELCHTIQYIYEFGETTDKNILYGNDNCHNNSGWMIGEVNRICSGSNELKDFLEMVHIFFYRYDPIEPYAWVFQVKEDLQNNNRQLSQSKVYKDYKGLVEYYKNRMSFEKCPRNMVDLKNCFTGLIMYLSVIDVRKIGGIRLLKPFLSEEYHFHPEKVFDMSEAEFKYYQSRTYDYICKVFGNFDKHVRTL